MKTNSKLTVVLVMTSCISLTACMSFTNLLMRGVEAKRCEDALCLDCVPGFCRERPVKPTPPDFSRISFNRNGTINGFPNLTVSALPAVSDTSAGSQNGQSGGGQPGGGFLPQNIMQSAPFGPGSLQPANLNNLAGFIGGSGGGGGQLDGLAGDGGAGGPLGTAGLGSLGGSSGSGGLGGLGGLGGSGGSGGSNRPGSGLSSDDSTTNSTGGPPVIPTTQPPKLCQCTWI